MFITVITSLSASIVSAVAVAALTRLNNRYQKYFDKQFEVLNKTYALIADINMIDFQIVQNNRPIANMDEDTPLGAFLDNNRMKENSQLYPQFFQLVVELEQHIEKNAPFFNMKDYRDIHVLVQKHHFVKVVQENTWSLTKRGDFLEMHAEIEQLGEEVKHAIQKKLNYKWWKFWD